MNQDLKQKHFAYITEVQRESLAALTAFPLKILDNVSSSGSGAGVGAASHRGSTLKGAKV
jgi:hypothetical protein